MNFMVQGLYLIIISQLLFYNANGHQGRIIMEKHDHLEHRFVMGCSLENPTDPFSK